MGEGGDEEDDDDDADDEEEERAEVNDAEFEALAAEAEGNDIGSKGSCTVSGRGGNGGGDEKGGGGNGGGCCNCDTSPIPPAC